MVAATLTLCGYSSGSDRVLSACFLCGLCSVPTPQGSQNSGFDFVVPQLPAVVGGGSPLQALFPCLPATIFHLFLSCLCCLRWETSRSLTPSIGAGRFCFNVDKAQDNFHRVNNLEWEKKLFIDTKRSDLRQQQKKLLLLL